MAKGIAVKIGGRVKVIKGLKMNIYVTLENARFLGPAAIMMPLVGFTTTRKRRKFLLF